MLMLEQRRSASAGESSWSTARAGAGVLQQQQRPRLPQQKQRVVEEVAGDARGRAPAETAMAARDRAPAVT